MSNRTLLESYAKDYTRVLGFKCRLATGGSGNSYAMVKMLKGGAVSQLTAYTDSRSLIRICQAFLDGHATATRQREPKVSAPITRKQFMDFFRSDEFNEVMTADDCTEIFLGSLKGSSDLSHKLLVDLCAQYDVSLQEVLNDWHKD